jgi:putative Holliday junction resolvase
MSDAMGWSAQGLSTLERRNRGADLTALAKIGREHGVGLWLIGLPLRLSGREGPEAERARIFGGDLERHTRIPVAYWDERLTTVEAGRMLREAGSGGRQPRGALDRMSAVILLQSYLDDAAQRRDKGREDE